MRNARFYPICNGTKVAPTHDELTHEAHSLPVALEISRSGFVPPWPGSDQLVQEVNGPFGKSLSVRLRYSYRDLPASVIREEVAKWTSDAIKNTGNHPGRNEVTAAREAIIQKLLPQAFIKHRDTTAFILDGVIVVDTSSASRAEELLGALRRALGTLPVALLKTNNQFAVVGMDWLKKESPNWATLRGKLQLVGTDGEVARFGDMDMHCDEITAMLNLAMAPERIGLVTLDGDSFTLHSDLSLRGVKIALPEDFDPGEDELARSQADQFLISNQISSIYKRLLDSFGGLPEGVA